MKKILPNLIFTFFIFSNGVFAKNLDKKNILPTINVIANKKALPANDSESFLLNLQKNSGAVSMVNKADLQNNFAINVKDMFDFAPGVLAQVKTGQEARLSIRGSGLSRNFHLRGINLYQDGVPINLADGSGDFQDIDPLAFDHLEIFKGASGFHLGSASLGGAINFVSPTGYNASSLKMRAEAGSFGTYRGHVSSGMVKGNFDYYSSLSTMKSDGFRKQNNQAEAKFYSNFGYRINNNLENRTFLTFVNSNLEMAGALTKDQMRNNPKQANIANLNNKQERNFNQIRLANKTSLVKENEIYNFGFYSNLKDLDHPIFQVVDQKTYNFGIFGDGKINHKLFDYKNEVNFGVNLSYGLTNAKRFVNKSGSATNMTQKGDEKSQNAIVFVENKLQLSPKFSLILASQFINAKRNFKDRFLSDGNQTGKREYFGISPKIGGVYNFDKDTEIFSNFSGAYEPPTFTEVRQTSASGLANINAQKSYNFEIGTRRHNREVNFDIALYHSILHDELMLYTIAPTVTQAINASKTMHQGIEAGIDATLVKNIFKNAENNNLFGDKLGWRMVYNFNDFRFKNDKVYGNNIITGAPKHYVRAELKYENNSGFYLTPNFEYVPFGFFIDSKNTVKTPNYMVWSVNSGFKFNKNLAIYLDVKNIFDKKYSPTTDVLSVATNNNPSVYHPVNLRQIMTGIKMEW
ncbi:MAG: TonB-dependent receptor family protein [Alphaproteobacteria bacterium]